MQQKAEHEAWLKRKTEREEKLAKGEEVGPEEPDPTAEVEVGFLGLLKFIVYCLIFIALAGKFFTGSFLWEYESHLPALKALIPVSISLICLMCSTNLISRQTSAFSLRKVYCNLTEPIPKSRSTLQYGAFCCKCDCTRNIDQSLDRR